MLVYQRVIFTYSFQDFWDLWDLPSGVFFLFSLLCTEECNHQRSYRTFSPSTPLSLSVAALPNGSRHLQVSRWWRPKDVCQQLGEPKIPSFIELDDGKIYRKPLYLMVKTMVSCRFSLKPIHWKLGSSHQRFFFLTHSLQPWRCSAPELWKGTFEMPCRWTIDM